MKSKTKQLTAVTLRIILSVSIVLTVAICVAIFLIANNKLQEVAVDVSRASVDAEASRNNLQALQTIQTELQKQKDTIKRTDSIVADSQSYQYQNQIIADLNNYASQAGLTITNLDFSATTGAAGSAPATPPATPPASGGTTPAGGASTAGPAGVKSTSVSVTLANPVDYKNLLNFIRLIEQNLTKMQVSRVGLSADNATGKVTSDTLTIEVYVK